MPVTLKIFGISATVLLPRTRIFAFAVGVGFWMVTGPVIKWAVRQGIQAVREEVTGVKK